MRPSTVSREPGTKPALGESAENRRPHRRVRGVQRRDTLPDQRPLGVVLHLAPAREDRGDVVRRRISDRAHRRLCDVGRLDAHRPPHAEPARGRAQRLEHPPGAIDEPAGLVAPVDRELDVQGPQGIGRDGLIGGDQYSGGAGQEEPRGKAAGVRAGEIPEVLRSREERTSEPMVVEIASQPGKALPASGGQRERH